MADMKWEEVDIADETVTEEDAHEIESGGKIPIGLYLCEIWESKPKELRLKKLSVFGVELTHKVSKVLEINNRPPSDEEKKVLVGKKITNEIPFPYDGEEDWSIRRRKNIALKIGIIHPGQAINKSMWQKDILGRFVIVRVVDNSYRRKDKQTGQETGPTINATKIGFFDGYESAGDKNKVVDKAEGWEDI